jgi:hypothetical protein
LILRIVRDDKESYLTDLREIYRESYNQFFHQIKRGNRVEDLLLLRIYMDNILTEIELIETELAKHEIISKRILLYEVMPIRLITGRLRWDQGGL